MNALLSRLGTECRDMRLWFWWALQVGFKFFMLLAWCLCAVLLMFQLHLLGLTDGDTGAAVLRQWSSDVPPMLCLIVVAVWRPDFDLLEERA